MAEAATTSTAAASVTGSWTKNKDDEIVYCLASKQRWFGGWQTAGERRPVRLC